MVLFFFSHGFMVGSSCECLWLDEETADIYLYRWPFYVGNGSYDSHSEEFGKMDFISLQKLGNN